MKNLKNFCVSVNNDIERQIALGFFKRAAHVPVHPLSNKQGQYVGLLNRYPNIFAIKVMARNVICGNIACPNETIIPFANINQLADSPNRKAALRSARLKVTNSIQSMTA